MKLSVCILLLLVFMCLCQKNKSGFIVNNSGSPPQDIISQDYYDFDFNQGSSSEEVDLSSISDIDLSEYNVFRSSTETAYKYFTSVSDGGTSFIANKISDNSAPNIGDNNIFKMYVRYGSQYSVGFASGMVGIDLPFDDIAILEQLLSGNKLPEKLNPIAQAYAGHQIGHF